MPWQGSASDLGRAGGSACLPPKRFAQNIAVLDQRKKRVSSFAPFRTSIASKALGRGMRGRAREGEKGETLFALSLPGKRGNKLDDDSTNYN